MHFGVVPGHKLDHDNIFLGTFCFVGYIGRRVPPIAILGI